MKTKAILRFTTGAGALMFSLAANPALAGQVDPSMAQDIPQKADVDARDDDETINPEILVVGMRESLNEAAAKKKNARQIVDSVVAEDAGKLPDNNVVEALARVPGINITRSRGQGDGLTIRGLDGVQTTINGSEVAGASARSISLADIPAELIKSVEVYKTRTADQVEGGIGGTVNIELRRPLDLKKGWTVAGSLRGSYGEQASQWSPYGSILVGNRFETGIGEIGFLVNVGYQNVRYSEPFTYNESPFYFYNFNNPDDTFRTRTYQSLPAAIAPTAISPYRVAYGVDEGSRKQPSFNGVLQWRANEHLNFILEGSYFGSNEKNRYNSLYVNTREDYYTLSNVRQGASGTLLGFDIANDFVGPEGELINFGNVRAGINAGQAQVKTDNYHTNFEAHWTDNAGVRIDAAAQYDWNKTLTYSNGYEGWFNELNRARVDFDGNRGGPSFDFDDVDPTRASNQRVYSFSDNAGENTSKQFAANLDLSVDVSSTALLRNLQIGARFRRGTNAFGSSYRYARWDDPATRPLLSDVPGVSTIDVSPNVRGGSVGWAQLNARQIFNNWTGIRSLIVAREPSFLDGPGRDEGTASLFGPSRASAEDAFFEGTTTENALSTYINLNYAFKAGFPIDGAVGVRYNNTFGAFTGRSLQFGRIITDVAGQPVRDADGNLQFMPDVIRPDSASANYVDLTPSAFATVHFTPKLQLRTSYSRNIQRPDIQSLRAFRIFDQADLLLNPNATLEAGNPDLRPTVTNDLNVALEWYFGRGGVLSVTAFRKKQTGFVYFTRFLEPVPEANGAARYVSQPRNAGPGRTEGLEFQATGFFSFLPGILKNFGASVNGTWIPTADLSLPFQPDPDGAPGVYELATRRAPFVSRFSYNLIGYFETPVFSARVAYNRSSRFVTGVDAVNETYISRSFPTSRLDAAVNVTPVKFLTLSVEVTNLLNAVDRSSYLLYPELPVGYREMGRTYQASARFRF